MSQLRAEYMYSTPRIPIEVRFWKYVNKTTACWLWAGARFDFGGVKRGGYGQIHVYENGRKKNTNAHRVSWEIHIGPIPDGMCVLHKCDEPACVRPDHLFIGTMSDNMRDCVSKKRHDVTCHGGIKNGRAKFTAEQVSAIRAEYAKGIYSQDKLAIMYGIGQSQVSRIVRREQWAEV